MESLSFFLGVAGMMFKSRLKGLRVFFLSPFWPLVSDPHPDRQDAALLYREDGGSGCRGSVSAAEETLGPSRGCLVA